MHAKRNWKFSVLIAVMSIFVMVAAQCSPAPAAPAAPAAPSQAPAGQQAQPTAASQPAASAVPAGQKTKVVYWSMFSEGEPLQKILAQAIDDFQKENPDIQVEVKWAGRQVLTQIQSAMAANEQIDIIDHSDDRVYNAIVATDLAMPLDKYLSEPGYGTDKPWKDTFLPGSFDQLKGKDGQIYMLPRDDYVSAFFYNAKMLSDAGIKPALTGWSWNDFTAALATIKSKMPGVSPLGADGNIAFYNNWWFSYLAVRLAGKDAFHSAAYDKTGEAWGAPEFLQAAKMIRDLQDKGYFQKGFEGSVWPAAQVDFVNSKIGMMFMGAWLPIEMSQQMPPDFKMDLFAFPSVDGGKGNDWVEHWANVYGVMKNAKDPAATIKLLKYLSSAKVGQMIASSGTPVPLVDVPVPPALKNQYELLKIQKQMPARAGLNTEIANYMDKAFNPCDDKFFQMQLSPEQFISCLKTESKNYWANVQ